ncbi:PHP domain-containing protein [Peribacillus cavernae]|uniref:PHP domain-containing protein n=1 Tax=Peribacillus cavernae TaxID=1674310 RepID=A0A433HLW1_9BACI|nr:PHP domain-containing protein [Peribacillus cavernae]MDQ0218929.1 putative metal-dependent phosphoesterase TrpH [Peribacillus cavernae]RUQ29358.1 PHP domain-containing protein [Peribacillus cavernae]
MDLTKIVQSGHFDLHMHTTASDGEYTPENLVKKAHGIGLKTIAITDHDTLAGLAAAIKTGEELGITVIRGIELSTKYKGKSVDILGYNVAETAGLNRILQEMRTEREERAIRIIKKFEKIGMPITLDDVNKYSGGEVISRPHIAKAIVEKGYVQDYQTVFDSYLADGKPCSIDKLIISPQTAIDFIHESGGMAVLAHPVLIGDDELIKELLHFNFDGIEVWHRKQNQADNDRYKALAKQFKLAATGGSDFHNDEHQLGVFGFHAID